MKIYEHFEAVPSRVLGLLNLLHKAGRGGIEETAAKALLQPTTLRKSDAPPSLLAPRTIEATLEAGLIVRSKEEDGATLLLAEDTLDAMSRAKEKRASLFVLLEQRLLTTEIAGKRNNFALLCAWMLAQSVTWLPQEHIQIQQSMKADGLDLAGLRVTSEANLDNVLYWARFLGLIWWAANAMAKLVIPDPTTFLLRHIDELLPLGQRVDVFAFRNALGALCPVLDGGSVRKSVTQQIATVRGQVVDDDRLSDALSVSLKQLAEIGVLRYDCPNDQRRFLRMYDHERIAFLERQDTPTGRAAIEEALV